MNVNNCIPINDYQRMLANSNSDSDEDDIEWENEYPDDEIEDSKVDDNDGDIILTINSNSNTSSNSAGGKKKPLRYDATSYSIASNRHKDDLLQLYETTIQLSTVCNDERLQSVILSAIPNNFHQHTYKSRDEQAYIQDLIQWFVTQFKPFKDKYIAEQHRNGATLAEDLIKVIDKKEGSPHQLTQIFVSLVRALKFETRLVRCIDPRSKHPKSHEDLVVEALKKRNEPEERIFKLITKVPKYNPSFLAWVEINLNESTGFDTRSDCGNETKMSVASKKQKTAADASPSSSNAIISLIDSDDDCVTFVDQLPSSPPSYLSLHQQKKSWYHADAIYEVFDDPKYVETKLKRKVVQYVLAIDNHGNGNDVTKRYANQWGITEKARLLDVDLSFWYQLCGKSIKPITVFGSSLDSVVYDAEDHTLNQTAMASMPTTLKGFKNHPLYILEKDMLQDQAINPITRGSESDKYFNSYRYHHRKDLEIVMSKDKWLKDRLKVVKDGEVPCKTVGKRELYGKWQTIDYLPPVIEDCVIPTNSYGNLEVWRGDSRFLPIGASLIHDTRALKVARLLQFPAVPALFDFECVKGNMTPVIGGTVVLSQHYDIVASAVHALAEDKADKDRQRVEHTVVKRWEGLVKKMNNRLHLKEKYGY